MEEAVEAVEDLTKELQMAKNDSARSKEESKGIRKRLAGCHFHYRQLQEQYDALLREKDRVDSLLAKAQKHAALNKKQAESWANLTESIREKRREADMKVELLTKENEELNLYCKELTEMASLEQELAASSVEEEDLR